LHFAGDISAAKKHLVIDHWIVKKEAVELRNNFESNKKLKLWSMSMVSIK